MLREKFIALNVYIKKERDFSGGTVVKILCFQCRRHRFFPWLDNRSHKPLYQKKKKKKERKKEEKPPNQ